MCILFTKISTGNDVIVGITDTGIYMDHDQFDQNSPKPFNRFDMKARKIVHYETYANSGDESDEVTCGHGTHVSGIIAGSSLKGYMSNYQNFSFNTGIASSARIAFLDIALLNPTCANSTNSSVSCKVLLKTPKTVEGLFTNQTKAGAKIISFSWGTEGDSNGDYNEVTLCSITILV